ncbi:ParA family protein [Diplocloster modestus]|uniref:ParA family protein n=1 Tax=Diplocloster modestus TaxID=2850322 RepID=A0ABS6KCP3_9FIRM|nr:ParA family protein [Diplocloster modestus]MBU9728283.1 ParA family protein [Diplocloster modestus]
MKVLSIVNLKGGVGKSTTAIAMAHLLYVKKLRKVLLIDNDPQGNTSRTFECYDPTIEAGTMNMLLTRKSKENIWNTLYEGIDIMPCNLIMEAAEKQVLLDTESAQHNRYIEALREIENEYDYCIIDNPPDIGMHVINALVASDQVIIPVNLDNWSLDGLEELVQQVKQIKVLNSKTELAGVLITNYEKSVTSEAAERWLRERSGQPIYHQKIRHSKQTKDCTVYHKPVTEYSIRCGASQDYKKFIEEYLKQEGI